MEKKKRYDKKRKRLGYDCDCGSFMIFQKFIDRKEVSLFKEEFTNVYKCNKCKKIFKIKQKGEINLITKTKKELKERFIGDMVLISKDLTLRKKYMGQIREALLFQFLGKFTKKERKIISEIIL